MKKQAQPVIFENKKYESCYALAKAYNKSPAVILKYKNNSIKLSNYIYGISNRHGITKDYIGTIIGDFEIKEALYRRHYQMIYKAICVNCGHEIHQTIYQIKHLKHCKNCYNAVKVKNTFDNYKNKIVKDYKILDYQYGPDIKYMYLVECIHCHKKKLVKPHNLENTLKYCTCHEAPKRKGKHHGETINEWLLEDTDKTAYNSRNTLYRYTCIHCGNIKYDQYSQATANTPCICQRLNEEKFEEIKQIKNKSIIKHKPKLYVNFEFDGKIYHRPKEISKAFGIAYNTAWTYIKNNDLEGLELVIKQKIYRYKKRMKLL